MSDLNGDAGAAGGFDRPDVEALMVGIRARAEEKRRRGIYRDEDWLPWSSGGSGGPGPGGGGGLSAPGASSPERLAALRASARVDLDGEAIASHRALTGRLLVFLKRASRWWVRKYTDILFLRQGAFNAEAAAAVADLRAEIDALKAEVAGLRATKPPGAGPTA